MEAEANGGMKMAITGKCERCGSTEASYYHGVLGYESVTCRKCGAVYDHSTTSKKEKQN